MTKLIRFEAVSQRIGLKRTAIYKRIRDGEITKPVKLGPKASAWPEHEIEAYSDALIKGKSTEEMRAMVTQLHKQRLA